MRNYGQTTTSLNTHTTGEQIFVLSRGLTDIGLKLFPYVSSASAAQPRMNDGGLGQALARCVLTLSRRATREVGENAYRAQAAVHCVLGERLAHGEGDDGGSDAGGRLDGEALALLADFHRGAGGRCHCNLPQQNVHTC